MTRKEYNIAVETYSDSLFGYALKFLRNSEDANDAVQDAFEKLWKNRKKVDNEKVKSWLFTTTHNGMVNWVTKNNRMRPAEEKDLMKKSYEDSTFENRELIEKLLVTLPPIQKSVLLFRDLEGYSYQEIGEMLNLGESQVKVYLFRARKKMKKQLKELKILA